MTFKQISSESEQLAFKELLLRNKKQNKNFTERTSLPTAASMEPKEIVFSNTGGTVKLSYKDTEGVVRHITLTP